MTYSQSANPNATNSELDSKRIITHNELNPARRFQITPEELKKKEKILYMTSAQKDELIDQYVDIVVDNMDRKILEEFVTEQLQYNFRNDYTDDELREEINNCDEELYDELVDNVTQQYPKQLNTFGG